MSNSFEFCDFSLVKLHMYANNMILPGSFHEGRPRPHRLRARTDVCRRVPVACPDVTPNGDGRRVSPFATRGREDSANEEAARNAKTTAASVCLGRELGLGETRTRQGN